MFVSIKHISNDDNIAVWIAFIKLFACGSNYRAYINHTYSPLKNASRSSNVGEWMGSFLRCFFSS
jgi:hypothetical protein